MTCARCEAMQEEVAYLRSELGLQLDATRLAALRREFGLSEHKARMVLVLFNAKGRVVSNAQLEDALPCKYREERSSNFINATLSQLRRQIGKESIENVFGSGYRISDAMAVKVAALLPPLPEKRGRR